MRGVVVAVYVYDDPNHPFANRQPAAMYCDVLVYSQMVGGRTALIRGALLAQEFASMQAGFIHKPRAATQTISGQPLDPSKPIDPTQLDGDHVLVGFIDDHRDQAVVLRAIPPPNQDLGHDASEPVGQRARLVLADGDPMLWKSHGSWVGIEDDGSFVCDVSKANNGGIDAQGHEIPSSGGGGITHRGKATPGDTLELVDNATGATVVQRGITAEGLTLTFLGSPGSLAVSGSTGPLLAISGAPSPGVAAVQLGAGGASLVSSSVLSRYLLGTPGSLGLIPWLTSHVHAGPGSPPTVPPPTPPSLANTQVSVPGV